MLSPLFLGSIQTYSLSVPYSVPSLQLAVYPEDSSSSLELGTDTSPDVPLPITTSVGDHMTGYCVVISGYGYVSANFSSLPASSLGTVNTSSVRSLSLWMSSLSTSFYAPRVRSGIWPLVALLHEANITIDMQGFFDSPTPAPTALCTARGGHCKQCANSSLVSGVCIDACPVGMYAHASNICLPCHISCARNCSGPEPTQCLPFCRNISTPSLSGGATVVWECCTMPIRR